MKNTVTIIDYGINNIQSVIQAFNYIDVKTIVADNSSKVETATHIVLPGVGAFPEGMKKLKNLGLDEIIKKKVRHKSNILGICLGMQMLFSKSFEHRESNGLSLISGKTSKIQNNFECKERVPVIGWRKTTSITSNEKSDFKDILNNKIFYYLHSYEVKPDDKNNVVAFYERCGERVNAAIQSDNIWGVQFHPEKSGTDGLNFLKAFSNLDSIK